MLTVEHNGLDVEKISPNEGAKYSPNLYQWLNGERMRVWSSRVYRDAHNILWIGILDGRELIGSKLIGVLCNGAKEQSAAWQNIDAVEVPNFWIDYMAFGRCAIDSKHSMWFIDDESRWQSDGASRSCLWCGKASQRLVRTTKTIETEEWVSE